MISKKSDIKRLTEPELIKLNVVLLAGVIGSLSLLLFSFLFLGPKIGGLFGYLSKYRNIDYNKDVLAPNAPRFDFIPSATKESTASIKGFAESGANIKLFVNGPEKGSMTADFEGKFAFENIPLIDGRNTIFAKAYDSTGNESSKSQTISVTVDKKDPEIEITVPKVGETVKNLDKRILVKGKVNEKSNVTVNERLAILKPDFSFEILIGVDEGDVEIKVVAIDEAGNKKEEKFKVKYEKSSI